MGATKEMYMDLMARVDMPLGLFKQMKEEHEMTLLKVHNPSNKTFFKQSKTWCENNEILKEVLADRDEIESEIRVKNQLRKC